MVVGGGEENEVLETIWESVVKQATEEEYKMIFSYRRVHEILGIMARGGGGD
jgi:hypothetical protein